MKSNKTKWDQLHNIFTKWLIQFLLKSMGTYPRLQNVFWVMFFWNLNLTLLLKWLLIFFLFWKSQRIRAWKLYPCPLLIKSTPYKAALSCSFISHRYLYEKMHNNISLFTSLNHTVKCSFRIRSELLSPNSSLINQSVILLARWFLLFWDWNYCPFINCPFGNCFHLQKHSFPWKT